MAKTQKHLPNRQSRVVWTEPQHRRNILILISEPAPKVREIAIYLGNPGLDFATKQRKVI